MTNEENLSKSQSAMEDMLNEAESMLSSIQHKTDEVVEDIEKEIRESTGLHNGSYRDYASYIQSVMDQNKGRTDDMIPLLTMEEWETNKS